MRRTSIGIGLAAAAAATATMAAIALAGAGGVSIEKKSVAFDSFAKNVTAKCHGDDELIGGGFNGGGGLVQRTSPKGGDWKVHDIFGPTPNSVTSYALCRSASKGKVKKVSKVEKLHPRQTKTVTAKCDRGLRVLGGGFAVIPPFNRMGEKGEIAPDLSKRGSKRSWKVKGQNESDMATTKLAAYALCEKADGPGVIERSKTDTLSNVSASAAVAKCPRRTHLVGGGFKEPADLTTASFPASSRKWRTISRGPQVMVASPKRGVIGVPGDFTSFAYCQRN